MNFLEEKEEAYELYILAPHEKGVTLKEKFYFDRLDLTWKATEIFSEGKKRVRITIYEIDGGYPSEFSIEVENTSFHLKMKDIKINGNIGDDYFAPFKATRSLPLSYFLRNSMEE
jgi:hypothetical protein